MLRSLMTQNHNRSPNRSDSFIPAYHRPYAQKTTKLSREDWRRFREAIKQKKPNENLKDAVRKHNEMLSSSDKT